jgi:hypothetical protein
VSNFEQMVSPQPVNFLGGGVDRRVEEHLQWPKAWLMGKQRKTDPVSLRIAARIRPSMMSLTILRATGTQSRKIDQLGQE